MHKHLEQKYFGWKDILHAENTAKKLRKAVYQLFHNYSQQKTNNLLHLYPILKTNWIGAALELQISCLHENCRIHHSSKSSNWIIWNCISEIFHQNHVISQIVRDISIANFHFPKNWNDLSVKLQTQSQKRLNTKVARNDYVPLQCL